MKPTFPQNLILAFCFFYGSLSFGQVESIDSTFGINGTVFTPLNSVGIKSCVSIVQTDGKIVLAGSNYDVGNPSQPSTSAGGPGYVVRYNPNGSLDSSFGVNGIYADTSIVFLSSIIQLSNGKLLLGGGKKGRYNVSIIGHEGVLKRLNTDGTLDSAFGNGGTAEMPIIYGVYFKDAKVNVLEELSNGKLVAYGTGRESIQNQSGSKNRPTGFAARFFNDGGVDTTFGDILSGVPGRIIYNTPMRLRGISKVLASNGDRILLGSSDYSASIVSPYGPPPPIVILEHQTQGIYKIDSLGNLDSSFSINGFMMGTAMAFQSNRILSIGYHSLGGSSSNPYPTLDDEYYVNRYILNGDLDTSFNNSSVIIDSNALATDLYVLPNNHFIVIGVSQPSGSSIAHLTVARFLPDGQLDSSCFGPIFMGLPVLYTAGPYVEQTPNIVKVEGSRMLVASLRFSGGSYGFQLAWYNMDSDSTKIYYANSSLYTNRTNATYQWINCNTMQPIAGATNQHYVPSANGSYAVIVTGIGCIDTSACYTVNSVGLDQWGTGNLSIYPNPGSGSFTIDFQEENFTGDLEIYTLNGKIVYRQKVNRESKLEIERHLSKGVYLLKVNSGKEDFTKRLIIH